MARLRALIAETNLCINVQNYKKEKGKGVFYDQTRSCIKTIQYLKESLQPGDGGEKDTGDCASSSGVGERAGEGELVCSGLAVGNSSLLSVLWWQSGVSSRAVSFFTFISSSRRDASEPNAAPVLLQLSPGPSRQ